MKRYIAMFLVLCMLTLPLSTTLAEEITEEIIGVDNDEVMYVEMCEGADVDVAEDITTVEFGDIELIEQDINESVLFSMDEDIDFVGEEEFSKDTEDEYEEVGLENATTSGVPSKLKMGLKQTFALDPSKITKEKTVSYKSSKPAVAYVNKKGVITAKKKGSAKISVIANKKTIATCQVTVVAAPSKVTLAVKSVDLGVKETWQIVPKLPKKTMASFTFTSKNKKVATVSKTGVVKGVKLGKTTVIVTTHNNKTVKLTVNVNKAPSKVTIAKKATIGKGEKLQLTATLPKGSASALAWSTDNKAVATVSKTGLVKGIKTGKAKITVKTFNKKKAVCTVMVKKAPTSVTLSAAEAALNVGEFLQLTATLSEDSSSALDWSSDNEAVATVDQNGMVTAISEGTANITVKTFNNKTAVCAVTVNTIEAPPVTPGVIDSISIMFGDITAGEEVVVLPDASVVATWKAEGEVASYYFRIIAPDGTIIASGDAIADTAYEIAAGAVTAGEIYTLTVGAMPRDGSENDIVWASARFKREIPTEGGEEPDTGTTENPITLTMYFDGKPALAGINMLPESGASISWTADSAVGSYYYEILDSGKNAVVARTATLESSFGLDVAAFIPGEIYAFNLGAVLPEGQESDAVWQSVCFMRKPSVTPADCFTYDTINGLYAKITGYTGEDAVVVIPETIDDYTIQSIGDKAFQKNKTLRSVFIPDTITEIGNSAFNYCDMLQAVDLGNGVTTIGNWAFSDNVSLCEFSFPASVTTLGKGILECCENLEHVDYPVNWESANTAGRVFADCPKLTVIDVPEGTKTIPNYAFANCPNLKRINLPEGLEQVYHHAFSNCTGLTEMVYPSTIKTVGGINGCTGINKITIPDGATIIGTSAFEGVPIETITVPNSVEEIYNYAFHNCVSLKTVEFGNSLKNVGSYAFEKCSVLTSLYLPDSVESIGDHAFSDCSSLSEFHYPLNWTSVTRTSSFDDFGHHFDNCVKLREISIPEGVVAIPRAAFAYATYLLTVNAPSTLKFIGPEAFKGCTAVTTLTFSQGLESVDFGAFEDCNNLQTINLPDSVNKIGCYAFSGCKNMTGFHYPASWNTVSIADSPWNGKYYLDWGHHFDGCTKLKTIEIPEGVTYIPSYAFQNAVNITKVIFPSTLKEMGFAVFEGCTGLTVVELPDCVEDIGCYAFAGCTNLTSFHFPINWKSTHGSGSPYHGKYYLDKAGHTFDGCINLKHVDIPEGVQRIPSYVFYNANGLVDISIPTTLQEVGKNAFANCGALEKIYLGYNVSKIEDNAFANCPALTIWTEYGATALQYAIDNNIPYYYLTPDGVNAPTGRLYQGDNYALYGYARSSVIISEVTAYIQNESGDTIQTITVNPNITDYNLAGTVNASLLFGNLSLGNYRYVLKAKTDISEEIWIDSSFTIVPPPLRIYISGYNISNGIIDSNNVSSISGTVISNYPITSLTVQVFMDTGTEGYNKTVMPNSQNYNLANLASDIPIDKLPVGNYTIRITATANGETRVLADNTFQPVSLDANVDDATIAKVASFVANSENADLFTTTYVNNVLGKMGAYEILVMAIKTRSDWIYGYASTVFTADHANQYLVELYEDELASIIADLNPAKISIEHLDSDQKFIADAILDGNLDLLDAYKQGLMDRFKFRDNTLKEAYKEHLDSDFKEIKDALKGAKTALKGVKVLSGMADSIAGNISNYAHGLEILNTVADSMNVTGSLEFKAAVNTLYSKYKSTSLNVTLTLLRQFSKDILGKGESEVIKMMTNVASESASYINGSTLYSIINFAIDASMKLSGQEQVAEDYLTFVIQVQAYEAGVTSYRDAFYTVKSGDTSAQAINRLLVAFSYARQAGIRIHDTILKLNNLTTDEAKQVLDYYSMLSATTII